jgi:DNA polymerase-3 subunit epsilon
MQLGLDSADRLASALAEAQEPMALADAARLLLSSARVPVDLQRKIVAEVVKADARLAWRSGTEIALAAWSPVSLALGDAVFCVVDLETTGIRPGADRIVEIGAVRVEGYELTERFERLVDPGVPLPSEITRLTGIRPEDLAGRVGVASALRAFLAFAGDAVLVAHNARFDIGFIDAELRRLRGRRFAGTVLDTVPLARKLVPGRTRYSLGALADRFSTDATPCHRALPDALATAEILLALVGKAQQRGAATVDDLVALCVPPARRAHAKRELAEAAPCAPGTYVMRDAAGQALYVGAAGDLRRRTMSYFRGAGTPRPVERVLPAVERLEFREAGSPFEARLDEIRLIGRLRPGANRQGARPDRLAFLRLERERLPRLVTADEIGLDGAVYAGPVGRRREADDVVRALRQAYGLRSCRAADPVEEGCLEGRLGRCLAPCRGPAERAAHDAAAAALAGALAGGGVPIGRLRARRAALAADQRFEEAARLRDDESALRAAGAQLRRIRAARSLHGVILCAHRDPRLVAAFAIGHGLVVEERPLPRGGDAVLEISALATAVERAVRAGPGTEGPHAVPAERRDEALHVAAAFARPASTHVAVRGDGNGLVAAVGAARARV